MGSAICASRPNLDFAKFPNLSAIFQGGVRYRWTLTPAPQTFSKMFPILMEIPLVAGTREELWKSTF